MPTGAWAGPPVAMKFGKTLDSGAGGFFAEANLPLLRYQYFHEKVAPLWDPYQGYGRPLAANQQSQPFYPLTLALLLHISPKTYNWFILSRLFLAGIGSYFFLRFFVSFWPGIAGGVTSMLGGYYLLFLTLPQLSAEVLLPASLLAAEYLLRKRNYWTIVTFAIVLLLVFLGGMPESALLLFTRSALFLPECNRKTHRGDLCGFGARGILPASILGTDGPLLRYSSTPQYRGFTNRTRSLFAGPVHLHLFLSAPVRAFIQRRIFIGRARLAKLRWAYQRVPSHRCRCQ